MKAMFLIGGFGTRLRPITYSVPKQLIPIAGKPVLYHLFDLLPRDVEEVVLATGYKAAEIDAYVRAHPPPFPTRLVTEAEPLGTGGGMKHAGGGISDPFYLVNSDVVSVVDFADMLARHRATGGLGTMALAEVEDPTPYGVADLGPEDRIRAFVEKPTLADAPSRWINAGIAIWRSEVLDAIPDGRAVSFERELVPGLLLRGIFGYRLPSYWDDAGTPERMLHSQRLLFDDHRGGPGGVPRGAKGSGPVAAPVSARTEGASFGPYVTLGDHVVVDRGAHVENSILLDGVRVGADAFVSGCLIGPGAVVRSGHRVTGQTIGAGVEA